MSSITIIWSAVAGACGMLAFMHLLVWLKDRRSRENLFFTLTVSGVVGLAACELWSMHAATPAGYVAAVRWAHVSTLVCFGGALGFIHHAFGTGRLHLLALTLGLRLVAVVANFTTGESLHVKSLESLRTIRFLGEEVSILGVWEPNRWVIAGQLSSLVLVIYTADASLRLWRRGGREEKRRALLVGGGLIFFALASSAQSGLVAAGVLEMPFLVSFPFLGMALAMGYELSRGLLRSIRLSQELGATEQRLAEAAAAAPLALWEWNIGRDEIWISDGGRMLHGVETGGKTGIARFTETVHPEDRATVSAAIDAALAGPGPYSVDHRVILPGGSCRWIHAGGTVERDPQGRALLLRGVSIDISERRKAEERFRHVIEAAPDAMVLVDRKGGIALVNARAESIFGHPRAELLGRPLETLVPGYLRGPDPGTRPGVELVARRKDGSEVPVEIASSPIEMPEGEFLLASILDIGARKQAEREAALHQEELAHLSRVSMLGELAGALAHELNQPLAAILGNSQVGRRILNDPAPDLPEVAAILDDITGDAKRAGSIIHGMRAMFKKDAAPELDPVDLNDAVTQVLGLIHSEILRRKVEVDFRPGPGLPPAAAGRVEIQQVVLNLVMNALDALAAVPRPGRIGIETGLRDGQLEVVVHDNGPGIPDAMIGRLFEPFASTKQGGLGLGLAISRSIAERFRGKLLADPHPEGGARFRLLLPASPEQDPSCHGSPRRMECE